MSPSRCAGGTGANRELQPPCRRHLQRVWLRLRGAHLDGGTSDLLDAYDDCLEVRSHFFLRRTLGELRRRRSGGLAFEYFAGDLSYGLTEATASNDGPITTNAQFTALAAAYNAAIPPASTNAGVAASVYPAWVLPSSSLRTFPETWLLQLRSSGCQLYRQQYSASYA